MEELARLENAFKVLANQKRLMILSLLLEEKEMFLQAISERLKIPLKTASRNLALLKTAGFVVSKTKRAQVAYEINTEAGDNCVITLLALLRSTRCSLIKKKATSKVDLALGSSFAAVTRNLMGMFEVRSGLSSPINKNTGV